MKIAIRSRLTGNVLYEAEAGSLREAVEKAVAAGVSLAGADLRNGDFRRGKFGGVDFRAADLRNADFTGAVLTGARMSEADCTGAKFVGAFLEAADMSNANLSRCDMRGAKLARANLAGVVADDAVLRDADVTEANADLAVLDLARPGENAIGAGATAAERLSWEAHHPHGPVRLGVVQALFDACALLRRAQDGLTGGWMPERVASAKEAAEGALDGLRVSARRPIVPGEAVAPALIARNLFVACQAVQSACKNGAQVADWRALDRAFAIAKIATASFERWCRAPEPLPPTLSAVTAARTR